MIIYKLDNDEKTESLGYSRDEKDWTNLLLDHFNGQPIERRVDLELCTIGRKKKSDMYYFSSGAPVFSERTIEVLKPMLDGKCQIFPVKYNEDGRLYVINVTNVVDCLNIHNSEVGRVSSGDIYMIYKYDFFEHLVEGHHIFKIPERLHAPIFVSQEFKAVVEEHKLKGFDFVEVWNSNREEVEEKKRRYEEALNRVRDLEGPEYTFDDAFRQLGQGKAFVSDIWKIQNDEKGQFILGKLTEDGEYKFTYVVYYPPILIGLKWKQTEPTKF